MTDTQTSDPGLAPSDKTPPIDLQKSRFTITTTNGAVYEDVKILPGHVVAAEREFDIRATDIEAGKARFEHILFMVWKGARNKGYPADFETFIEEVEEMDIGRPDHAAGNPTQPAR